MSNDPDLGVKLEARVMHPGQMYGQRGGFEFFVDDERVDKETYHAIAAGVQANALAVIAEQLRSIHDDLIRKAVHDIVDAAVAHAAGILRGVD